MLLACFVALTAAKKKKDEDATEQAIKDLKLGMAGIQEAASNPAVLAQLMQDLQVSATIRKSELCKRCGSLCTFCGEES